MKAPSGSPLAASSSESRSLSFRVTMTRCFRTASAGSGGRPPFEVLRCGKPYTSAEFSATLNRAVVYPGVRAGVSLHTQGDLLRRHQSRARTSEARGSQGQEALGRRKPRRGVRSDSLSPAKKPKKLAPTAAAQKLLATLNAIARERSAWQP